LTIFLREVGKNLCQKNEQRFGINSASCQVVAGNRGFIAIGDWLKAYHAELVAIFNPPKGRLPSYSTIRRTLLRTDYQAYSGCLSRFFSIQPFPGETIAIDGKVLRGS
jgi:hypothetical protein